MLDADKKTHQGKKMGLKERFQQTSTKRLATAPVPTRKRQVIEETVFPKLP